MGALKPAAWLAVAAVPLLGVLLGGEVLLAALAWLAGLYGMLPGQGPRRWALLAFPVLAVASVDAPSLLEPRIVAVALMASAATLPLWAATGARVPWRGVWAVVGAVAAAAVAVALWPWPAAIGPADIATRTQALLLAAAGLVAVAVVGAWSARGTAQR